MLLSLRSFGVCVGLVFGAFSEGSTAVHQLLKHAASGIAEAQWQEMCCLGADDATPIVASELYRDWGVTAVKSWRVRHLLIGVKFADPSVPKHHLPISRRFEQERRELTERASLASLGLHLHA